VNFGKITVIFIIEVGTFRECSHAILNEIDSSSGQLKVLRQDELFIELHISWISV
jgi:hypothetical protein